MIVRRLIIASLLLFASTAFAQQGSVYNPFTGKFDKCLWIETEDGTVKNITCGKTKVSDGTLTNNLDGTFSLSTGSGGGVGVGTIQPGVQGFVSVYTSNSTTLNDSPSLFAESSNVGVGTSVPLAALHIGESGTLDFTGTGDVYVQNDLEVDGGIYTSLTPSKCVETDSNGKLISASDACGTGGAEVNNLETITTGIAATEIPIGTGTDTVVYNTLSGDVTITSGGVVSISANAVELATDTTGNYVATVADDGQGTMTVNGSGSENAAVTLRAVDLVCTDCLNATEIEDIYVLNSSDAMSGTLTVAGNVGIGTTDTTQTLLQVGTAGTPNFAGAGDLYAVGDLEVDGTIYGNTYAGATGVGLAWNVAVATCTGDGNAGALTVNGSNQIICSADDGGGSSSGWVDDGPVVRLETAADNVGIGTITTNNKLTVLGDSDISGFLGLGGQTTPLATNNKLSVLSPTSAYNSIFTDGTVEGAYWIDGSGFWFGTKTNHDILFMTSGTERIRINNVGNLGINTTNPEYKLKVVAGGGVYQAVYSDNTTDLGFLATNTGGWFGTITDHDLILFSNNVRGATLRSGGNFGIGTSVPESLLHVGASGTLNFTGTGDVYVQNDIEVDGGIYTSITASKCVQTDVNGRLSAASDVCGTGGSGDNITVNSTAADTTANFLNGDIDWTLVDGGPGGPDDVTATVACTGCIDDTDVINDITIESTSAGYFNGGNVGIGTTDTTQTLLQVGSAGTPNFAGAGDLYIVGNLEVDGLVYAGNRIQLGDDFSYWDFNTAIPDSNIIAFDGFDYLEYDRVDNAFRFHIGAAPNPDVEFVDDLFSFQSNSVSSVRGVLHGQHNDGTEGARLNLRKSRGTKASPDVISSGDILGNILGYGYDGSDYLDMASIQFGSVGTIAGTRVPTKITFHTATDATPSVLTERMVLNEIGNLGIGTPSPLSLLHVGLSGTLNFVGSGDVYVQNDIEVDGSIYASGLVQGECVQGGANGMLVTSGAACGGTEINNLETITTGIATGEILVGTGTDTAAYVTANGDVTITSTGLTTIQANSVVLTTDTVGSYAAGDGEAGNALTGDSATAFFSVGTIEHERGGLEVDVSVYEGILAITGGGTYELNTISELETAVGAVNILLETEIDASSELLALMDDEVGTGLLVFNAGPNFTGNVGIGTTVPMSALQVGASGTLNFVGTNDVYFQNDLEVDGTIYGGVHAGGTGDTLTWNVTPLTCSGDGNAGALTVNGSNQIVCSADDGGSGSGAFSDAGDPVVLNTTTKDVVIGTGQVNTSKLTIDGDADQVQLTVQGNGTQTADIASFEASDGTSILAIDAVNVGIGTANPIAKLQVIGSGNSGIGTTAPLALLHVGGGGTLSIDGTDDLYVLNDLEVDGAIYGNTYAGGAGVALIWNVNPATCTADVTNGGALTVNGSNQIICSSDDGGGGAGDVESVGDCASGACLDGTSDGGTNIALYDGDSNKGTIATVNLTGDRAYSLPNEDGTVCTTGSVCSGYQASLGFTAANAATTITVAGTANEITSSAGAQDLSTNRTWTLSLPATVNLSGKTAFAIPTGTNPTVDSTGYIGIDTTDGQLIFYGTAERVIPYKRTHSKSITAPVGSSRFLLERADDGMTIHNINCIVDPADSSESVVIAIYEADGNGDFTNLATNGLDGTQTITCANTPTADDGSLSNNSVDAGDWIGIDIGTVTGTVSVLTVSYTFSVVRE
jgi:hypothetical protein